jgi:tetrachlorobenzoquinone reductase
MESTALFRPPEPAGTIEVHLETVSRAAIGISLFEFVGPNALLPEPNPGAHIDVHLPGGLVRQYSLVTPLCAPGRYVVAVKREPEGRGGSRYLHDELRPGFHLRIGVPRNTFELDEHTGRSLFLAGGIGITPLYGMFSRLRELRRPAELHYWCSSPDHALFQAELARSTAAAFHYSASRDRPTVAGVVGLAGPDTRIYCCGPARMIEEAIAHVGEPRLLRVERFAVPALRPMDGAVRGFTVHLARMKRDIAVEPGQTILGALVEAGVDVPYSCEEGLCGACETKVLTGEPLHRDSVRTPEEHARLGTIMICSSLSRSSRLVLDI